PEARHTTQRGSSTKNAPPPSAQAMLRLRSRASAAFASARRDNIDWKYQLIAMKQYPAASRVLSARVTHAHRASCAAASSAPLNQRKRFIVVCPEIFYSPT